MAKTAQTWGLVEYRDENDIKGAWLYHQLQMRGADHRSTPKQIKDYADRKKINVEIFKQHAVDECPICLDELNYGRGDNKFMAEGRTPSLDNRDPNKGYSYNNTRIICSDCNSWKSTYTLDVLREKAVDFPDNERLGRLIVYIEEGISPLEHYAELMVEVLDDEYTKEDILIMLHSEAERDVQECIDFSIYISSQKGCDYWGEQ